VLNATDHTYYIFLENISNYNILSPTTVDIQLHNVLLHVMKKTFITFAYHPYGVGSRPALKNTKKGAMKCQI
jgi:hypothetical protein